jgi:hypothetical protein
VDAQGPQPGGRLDERSMHAVWGVRTDAGATGRSIGVVVRPPDDLGPDAGDPGRRPPEQLVEADRPDGRGRERIPRRPARRNVPEQGGPKMKCFAESLPHVGGDPVRRPAAAVGDDVAEPADEIRARRDLAVHAGQVEVCVRVNESRNDCGVAEIDVRGAGPGRVDGGDEAPADRDRAVRDRGTAHREDPAGGQRLFVGRGRHCAISPPQWLQPQAPAAGSLPRPWFRRGASRPAGCGRFVDTDRRPRREGGRHQMRRPARPTVG